MMKNRALKLIVIVAVATTMFSGCMWAPELDSVRKEIQNQIPGAKFDREFAISLGPLTLMVARAVVRFIPEAEEAHTYLAEVRSVKVAVYEVRRMPRDAAVDMPDKMKKLLEKDDWQMAVRVREDDDNVWVLYREKNEHVAEVFVAVLDRKELVLVRATGKMDRILEKALANNLDPHSDFGFDFH